MSRRTSYAIVYSIILVAATLTIAAPPAAATTTHVVCPSPCPLTTVNSAIAVAVDGDTIAVRPGTYVEDVVVSKAVTVCATITGGSTCIPNANNVRLEGTPTGGIAVRMTASGAVLTGLTVRNPSFAVSDQDAAADVEATLVRVEASGVQVLDNVLTSPATAPEPSESRWRTVGIHVASGSNVLLSGNTLQGFVAPAGPLATCPSGACKVIGVWASGAGAGLTLEENDIRVIGTGTPAATIQVSNQPGLVIRDNYLRVAGSAPGSDPIAATLYVESSVSNALVEGNDMAVGLTEPQHGAYGAFGVFRTSTFRDNVIRTFQHGLMLRSAVPGDNVVEENYFWDNAQGVLSYAEGSTISGNTFYLGGAAVVLDAVPGVAGSSTNVVLRDNEFRNHTRNLAVTETVTETYIDARQNDWGQYSRQLIETRIDDAGTNNTIDVSCYIDNDGVTLVCPTADFTWTVSGTTWPRTVTFTDTSTYQSGNTFASREWTLPGGPSTEESPAIALQPGTHAASLKVVDSEGFEDTRTRVFTLANLPPTVDVDPAYPATEGALFTLDVDGADPDGDGLAYSLTAAPAGMSINAATGVISWTPTNAQQGAHSTTVRVTDGAASATDTFTVNVANVPVGPVIDPIAPLSIIKGTTGQRNVRATSAGGVTPTLSATGVPANATFTDNGDGTGKLVFPTNAGDLGTYTVTVSATAESITTTRSFVVSVTETVGVDLIRVTTSTTQASPGQTVLIHARVKNTGGGADAAVITATSNRPWTLTPPAPISYAQNETIDFAVAVVVPANGDVAFVDVKACSQAAPTVCKTLRTRVEVPVFATLEVQDEPFGPFEFPTGTVTARFLNGQPAVGAVVEVEERNGLVSLVRSTTDATTNATGVATFEIVDPRGSTPGAHLLTVVTRWGEMSDVDGGSYRVLV